jgi:uncharacterized protein (DUF1499 family)
VLILTLFACGAPPPDGLGPTPEGTLRACPGSPNCVHTGNRDPEGTEPILLRTDLDPGEAMVALRGIVQAMPRTTVVTLTDDYLHAEVRTRVFRFIDDLELLLAPDRELIVRSAARLGKRDFGVNARRVRALRAALAGAGLLR